jgi:hypothetical protein
MSSDRTEIQSLMQRWRKKNGHPMPIEIARLPIDKIRKAVKLTEADVVVGVPLSLGDPANQTDEIALDSMAFWDSHKEH